MRESIFPCLFPPYTVSTLNLMVLHKISIPPSLYSPPGGPTPPPQFSIKSLSSLDCWVNHSDLDLF